MQTPDEDIEKIIELTGQGEIPMDVWIDDDQRVRRMEWRQSVVIRTFDSLLLLCMESDSQGRPS